MRGVAKIAEPLVVPAELANVMRRAFSNLRNGRGGPAIVEIPTDIWNEEIGELDYTPVGIYKFGPDPADVRKAAAAILAAKRPVIYAGTGVQWAEAWPQLRAFAELLGRAGHHQPGRQEFVPGEPSAVARLGRQRGAEAGASLRAECRPDHRHRLFVHRNELRHQVPQGQEVHPRHAGSEPSEQGRGQRPSAWWATRR